MSKFALYGYTYYASKELGDQFDGAGGSAHRRSCKIIGCNGRYKVRMIVYGGKGKAIEVVTSVPVFSHHRKLFTLNQLCELPDLNGSFAKRSLSRRYIVSSSSDEDHVFLRPTVGSFLPQLEELIGESKLVISPSPRLGHYNKEEMAKTSYSNRRIHFVREETL